MEPAEESPVAASVVVRVWVCGFCAWSGTAVAESVGAAVVCEAVS
jgi:hypothetical protein